MSQRTKGGGNRRNGARTPQPSRQATMSRASNGKSAVSINPATPIANGKGAAPVTPAQNPAQAWGGPQPVLTMPDGRPVNPWVVLGSIIFGFFMSLLDATIVNIALPSIQTQLNTDLTTVSWVINAYSIVFAVLLVTMGRFADQFGRKRMFMIGMVLFSAGSLLCAISPSIGWLIVARALQGIGAGTLNPISLAIFTAVFPANKRGAAIGIWGALAGLAAAVGPVLGGFLVQKPQDWPSIFYVNLPFCVVGLFLVWRNVPETRDPNTSKQIDILGLLTLSIGLFCLVLAIIQSNDWGWTSFDAYNVFGVIPMGTATLLIIGVLGLIAFYIVESRQKNPILDFALFRVRSFSAANLAPSCLASPAPVRFLSLSSIFRMRWGKVRLMLPTLSCPYLSLRSSSRPSPAVLVAELNHGFWRWPVWP